MTGKKKTGSLSKAQVTNQAYEAASVGRRLRSWQPGSSGPNALNLGNLGTLRSRSRDASRNNAWIANGLRNWVADEIGTGIVPRSQSSDEQFRRDANALWEVFVKECDADGVLDFYGMLALAARSRKEAGEVFIRFRTRKVSDGLAVPLQLQLLEAEFCPSEMSDLTKGIRAGIQFSAFGKREFYHMYRNHPGEHDVIGMNDTVAVPAESVIHHYMPLRPGQLRGIPETIQALIKAKDFDEYDDAELQRKKTKSAHTGAITRPDYGEEDYKYDPFTGELLKTDASGAGMTNVEAGSLFSLLPGEDIKLFDGDSSGSGYADFIRQQLLGIAAGMGVPYEILSGDMSKINDRTLRAILNQYHRILEQTQWLFTIPQICDRVWKAFIDHAVMSGALIAPDYDHRKWDYQRVEWRTDGWAYLHPVQDVQSKIMQVSAGFKSRSAVVAENGWDADEVDRQQSADNARAAELGLNYSTSTTPEIEPEEEDDNA
jgi:lambda family phage portal protein